ncbi:four helix bundle protein [Nitrosophilus labii]|uniref:four helix bundle protein n=1 Tax=Nitrosophilus labii TaxID=2706014 RepID=UPI0016572598|nr:four helix bundle protein [Nitrosophilus labii]
MKCENLDVWKRSSNLCVDIYKYFKSLKDYSFKDQITRSSLLIPSNIAEGFERISDKETIRFIDISKGSIAELKTQIFIGIKIGYISKNVGLSWIDELNEISKMLSSLIKKTKF